ncbi:autotransporter assembly complex protein TamA [Marinobacter zhejiangensis]|uniref:Translocation and assembly module subunit TamA n=1 Tax=Marinobacter zhejiangensis TaxID=488535 RepID=A0A1I4NNE8_9GAMM|nr:autotransporter assembly complex family protein [Marinobacter zhejiangensis]SFM16683.1 autotransporter secretion outer membrane protein TamA [Marinobacter zhejiangensis]
MPRGTRKFKWVCWPLLWLVCALAQAQQVEVVVEGDFPELQDNANAFIGEVEGRSAQRLRRYVPTAMGQVRDALKALGYYQPEIEWTLVDDGLPTLVLTVTPGEPVHVRSVTVTIEGPANTDPDFLPVLPDRPAVGDVLNHGHYDSLRQLIRNQATRLGYFDGTFERHTLEVSPEAGYADITLAFTSGQRYRLGGVTFTGGEEFERELLERFVSISPGELYHADKVATLNSDLSNSGYFAQVLVEAIPEDADGLEIPVVVQLTAREPRSVSAGVGFSTDVGPRFKGTWREHWVNPMGHRRGAETELSGPRQNVSAWYELPLDPPMTDLIRLTAGYQMEDIEDVESERLTLGQQWQHELDSGWLQILSLRAEAERYSIGSEPSSMSRLLLPGLSYSRLRADSPLDPSRGYRIQFDVSGAHRKLFSDADVLHVNVLMKGLITVWGNHRLLTRFQFGGVATNSFDDVPPSLRFFAGGDQSVRGYDYQSLSPRDDDGNLAGGRYLMVGSGEYQYSFAPHWRVAAFFDRGNAIDNLTDALVDGVGAGIRWVSPVGPLKFDIAKGLDENFGGDWRIHFSMGPEL